LTIRGNGVVKTQTAADGDDGGEVVVLGVAGFAVGGSYPKKLDD
jgi:hypothetical protein